MEKENNQTMPCSPIPNKKINVKYGVANTAETYESFQLDGVYVKISEVDVKKQPTKLVVGCTEKGPEQPPVKTTPRGFIELSEQKEINDNENK